MTTLERHLRSTVNSTRAHLHECRKEGWKDAPYVLGGMRVPTL